MHKILSGYRDVFAHKSVKMIAEMLYAVGELPGTAGDSRYSEFSEQKYFKGP